LLLLQLSLPGQGPAPKKTVISPELLQARKEAAAELKNLKKLMLKLGCQAEAADCDSIMGKLNAPKQTMADQEPPSEFPGDKAYEKALVAWSEAGEKLARIYGDKVDRTTGEDRKELELFGKWFATFPDLAEGIRHLNRRRRFCKLPPVTQDWSGSIGGYYHGLYLQLNKDVTGLDSHKPSPGRPGWTPEGDKAAHAILARGDTAPKCIDMWLNSRFHRNPVFNWSCGRVSLGGMRGGVYSCRLAGTGSRRPIADIMTWPGDGDTDIPRTFRKELPNPFPPGINESGTVVVVLFAKPTTAKVDYELRDEKDSPVETLLLDSNQPLCFAAKNTLDAGTRYTVRIAIQGRLLHTFSFTTR